MCVYIYIYTYIYILYIYYICTYITTISQVLIYEHIHIYIYVYTDVCNELDGIQWSLVQIPLRPTSCSCFKESFSGEYNRYQFILLHSCDYLKKVPIKINEATDEGNSRNEI